MLRNGKGTLHRLITSMEEHGKCHQHIRPGNILRYTDFTRLLPRYSTKNKPNTGHNSCN